MRLGQLGIALIALGSVMLGSDLYSQRLTQPFRGEIRIAKDHSESIAIAPTADSSDSHATDAVALRRAVPATEIPFDNPRIGDLWTVPTQAYDVFHLPFGVGYSQSTILAPTQTDNLLSVQSAGEPTPHKTPIHVGDAVELSGVQARIEAIRPWAGILRHASGNPMASVAVRTPAGPWIENLILGKGSWLRVGSDLAIHLVWYDSEQSAHAAIASEAKAPTTESARWGAIDGGGVNWLESFIPGTGLTLRDGTVVFLVQVDLEHFSGQGKTPAILIETEKSGARRLQWIMANAGQPDAPFQFDFPAVRDTVLVVHAWQDLSCIVTASLHHRPAITAELKEGETWAPKDAPYAFRLDQLLSSGIPVNADQSPLNEIVVTTPQRTLRLRQDESITLGDSQVSFVQAVTPPRLRYALRIYAHGFSDPRTITLGPDDAVRVGDIVLAQGPVDTKNLDTATLTVATQRSRVLCVTSLGPLLMGLVIVVQTLRSRGRGCTRPPISP